jgi:hypothetical protein
MPFFKKRNSSRSEEMVIILQKRVEELEETANELKGMMEKVLEAINHGQITQIEKESEDKQDLKIQVVDNKRALPDAAEETELGCLEEVNGQDNTLGQTGEVECSVETVLLHEEGLQGEDIGTEAATQSHQGMFNRRIRCIGIFVVSCAVGMLLWGVYKWGVVESVSTIPVRNWIPPRYQSAIAVYRC